MNETTVNERIKMLVEHFSKGNKSAFARAVGISNQSLAEILGTRQSSPSFSALQKILSAFPQVRIEWFVFGRGEMLRQDEAASAKGGEVLDPSSGSGGALLQAKHSPGISPEAWQQLQAQVQEVQQRLAGIDEDVAQRKANEDANSVLYSITGPPNASRPYDGLLSTRLGITEEEALELAKNEEIEVWFVGNPKRTSSWRVSESSVRQFLKATAKPAAKG